MRSRLSRNTALLLANNLASAVLAFALTALIGRLLGADGLGIYAAVAAWILPLSMLVDFGLSMLMTRDLAAQPEGAGHMLRHVMLLRLLVGGIVMALVLVAAPILTSDPQTAAGLRISAPMVIILPMFSAFTSIFKAHDRMQPILWLNSGMLVAQVLLTGWALAAGYGVLAAVTLNVLTSAGQLAAAWLWWRLKFHVSDDVPAPNPISVMQIRSLLNRAYPFAIAALFVTLQVRLSLIFLEYLAPIEEAGYFAAASRFTEAARLIPNAYFGALLPALAALAINRAVLDNTFRTSQRGITVFGIAVAAGFMVASPLLIELVYDSSFTPAAPTLAVLAWSLLFSLLRGNRTLYWYALKRDHFINRTNGAVLVIQAVLSLCLIPLFYANGAALASLAAEIAGCLLLWREWSFSSIRRAANRSDHDFLHQP